MLKKPEEPHNALAHFEPLERAIILQLEKWPGTWTSFDHNVSSAIDDKAIELLIKAGMLEARLTLLATWSQKWWETMLGRSVENVEIRFRVRGSRWGEKMRFLLHRHTPAKWWKNGGLRRELRIRIGEFEQIRRTEEGEVARHDLQNGIVRSVLDFVFRRGFFANYSAETIVDVESQREFVQSRPSVSPDAKSSGVNVAAANASASVGDVHVTVAPKIDVRAEIDPTPLVDAIRAMQNESRLHSAPGQINRDIQEGSPTSPTVDDLPPAVKNAWFAYQWVATEAGRQLQDQEAYDLIKEKGIPDVKGKSGTSPDYDLPVFETWAKYLRTARSKLGESKYTRRNGRPHGRSIVRSDTIDGDAAD